MSLMSIVSKTLRYHIANAWILEEMQRCYIWVRTDTNWDGRVHVQPNLTSDINEE